MNQRGSQVAVFVAALLTIALMAPSLGEPYGGFIAFSEAWYTLVARNFATGSLLSPQVVPGVWDFNIPPLFSWLLHAAFSLLGTSDLTARAVAVAGGATTVLALGALAGPRSAFLLASTPAFVLLGQNVQPDTWSTALSLTSLVAWRRRRPVLSSIFFGLALVMKPTVLMFPAALALAEVVERRRVLAWMTRRHLLWAGLSVVPTAAWIAFQITTNRDAFLAGLDHGRGAFELPDLSLAGVLTAEVVFVGFPLLSVFTLLGIVRPSTAPSPLRRPALSVLGVGLVTYLFVHYHGYYLVALTPAAAIVAAPLLPRSNVFFAALLCVNALASQVYLGGHKLGRVAVVELARATPGARFMLAPNVYEGYWTLFAFYGQASEIVQVPCAPPSAAPIVIVPWGIDDSATLRGVDRPMGFAILGIGLAETPSNPHKLAWGPLSVFSAPLGHVGFFPSAGASAELRAKFIAGDQGFCPRPPTPPGS